ncbi:MULTISPECIES: DUF2911 domain-containing protein [Larkinella]|uniref:DUF2911 domain-containing protein n=1 Tax=Larkinella punicea TaxID=2315727 RepID=A0A368JLT8_9BACT|nr:MULTISPECIES: DUF2911 domain-containing protein [Larkinella]RCR67111.1 DUF2911 domain-containing protein [Larkinella punicea]
MNQLKKNTRTLIAVGLLSLVSSAIRAQLNLPEPSPSTTIHQKIGFTDVTLRYSRPGVKGRIIFGGLVPFGKLWRTGASDATIITFSDSMRVAGTWVPKGAYSLFTIPEDQHWTVILNTFVEGHGTEGYSEKNDLLRLRVKPQPSTRFYESFTIEVQDLTRNNGCIYLHWANTSLAIPLESTADRRITAEILDRINVKKEDRPGLYYQAALYYFDNEKDTKQALSWATKAVQLKPAFNYLHLQAKLLARHGDYKAAVVAAKQSAEMAKAEKIIDYVIINNQFIAEWEKKQ